MLHPYCRKRLFVWILFLKSSLFKFVIALGYSDDDVRWLRTIVSCVIVSGIDQRLSAPVFCREILVVASPAGMWRLTNLHSSLDIFFTCAVRNIDRIEYVDGELDHAVEDVSWWANLLVVARQQASSIINRRQVSNLANQPTCSLAIAWRDGGGHQGFYFSFMLLWKSFLVKKNRFCLSYLGD
jgi:hypothetical protein